jgi:hypothetical protein
MAKELTQFIVDCNEDGKPEAIGDLSLPQGFARRLRWDSRHTRMTIENLINREIRVRLWLGQRYWWFDENKGLDRPGWKTWLEEKGLPMNYFWDPYGLPKDMGPSFRTLM